MSVRFEVRAETAGGTRALLASYETRAEAEEHPVKLSEWKRVWIAKIERKFGPKPLGPRKSGVQTSAAVLDHVFGLLVEAANHDRRCPQLHEIERGLSLAGLPFGGASTAVPCLARAGKIRIEIFAHNYRVVTICDGPHRGAATARLPAKYRPYLVIMPGGEKLRPGRHRTHAIIAERAA